ncbi:MAG: aminopeptidase P family protein [Rhodobacteraceae bacterium]|nr:aminopeptidase P family protein [Paracoccaceae bacterium]
MPQDFSDPEPVGRAGRLAMLRRQMRRHGIDAFMVPVADAYGCSPLPACDRRLEWLTGFSGSAGLCIVSKARAALFVDGRYTSQAGLQIDQSLFEIHRAETGSITKWLSEHLPTDASLGIDAWLHADSEVERLRNGTPGINIKCTDNLIDSVWQDQPAPPDSQLIDYPATYSGEPRGARISRIAETLAHSGAEAMILTNCNSIAWLLNIRASDIARNPVKRAFAILNRESEVALFARLPEPQRPEWLQSGIRLYPLENFLTRTGNLSGSVLIDPSVPHQLVRSLRQAGIDIVFRPDPVAAAKSVKHPAEIKGMEAAHIRDGVAMAEFLAWLQNRVATGPVSEIGAAMELERLRAKSELFRDLSFDTISASGPNAAIIHYRVTHSTNRQLRKNENYLVDSGGQYLDGTTDVTRTVGFSTPRAEIRERYTEVLRGLIALSTLRWPATATGRVLDPIARQFLWRSGHDFGHGTGHGVGHYLDVHEGPAGISGRSEATLKPGMILSIEPGFYAPGKFGIRLENLVLVTQSSLLETGYLEFRTLTLVPFDHRLINPEMLSTDEKSWLNVYHRRVRETLAPQCTPPARAWLSAACAPLPLGSSTLK